MDLSRGKGDYFKKMWKKIAYLLEKNDMNRNQLAKGTEISYGKIQDWKSGKCQPSHKALEKIAKFFSVPSILPLATLPNDKRL